MDCTNYGVSAAKTTPHAKRKCAATLRFFGAPTAIFVFVHGGLREFSVFDAGIFMQSLMLSAHAHGLGTCAQGALATWTGPVRQAFEASQSQRVFAG